MVVKKEPKRVVLGPKSLKQKLFVTDNSTNIILYGGGKPCASTLKTLS